MTLIDFTASNVQRPAAMDALAQQATTRGIDRPSCSRSASCSRSCSSPRPPTARACSSSAASRRRSIARSTPTASRSPSGRRWRFGATLQIGETFHAVLLDSDLLDAQLGNPTAARPYSLALRNALFTVTGPRSLVLFGVLENGRLTSGLLALTHDIYRYLPTLPDPYVASYTGLPARVGGGRVRGRPAGAHRLRQVARPVSAPPRCARSGGPARFRLLQAHAGRDPDPPGRAAGTPKLPDRRRHVRARPARARPRRDDAPAPGQAARRRPRPGDDARAGGPSG